MVASGNGWLLTDFLGRNEQTWKRPRRIKSTFDITSLLDASQFGLLALEAECIDGQANSG